MKIIGGTYVERVLDHNWHELYGSGLRACCVLPSSETIDFYTYIGEDKHDLLKTKSSEFKFNIVQQIIIRKTVEFQYLTSLSEPLIVSTSNSQSQLAPISVTSDDAILCFGLIQGEAVCHGNRVVYDPQSPNNPQPYYDNGSTAKELAIIMNRREALAYGGVKNSVCETVACCFKDKTTKVVIIKDGPKGAKLYIKDGMAISIPAFITTKVFSVGSGDVFSAFFAYFWADKGEEPISAAMKASKAVALYVSSDGARSQITENQIESFNAPPTFENIDLSSKLIYLASPFFTLQERWFVEETLRNFKAMGVSVFSPLHNVGVGMPQHVYSGDIEGLEKCDVVFANLCGFDIGTVYEIGYAQARGTPVVAFSQNANRGDLTMLIGGNCEIFNDYTSAVYNTVWKALK